MENRIKKSNIGYTIFKPTGERYEYPQINLEKQQVLCTVIYQEKTYMTVMVDLKSDRVTVEGSVDELENLSMDKKAYIDMFKEEAKFFIDNKITNAKAYYEEVIRNLR